MDRLSARSLVIATACAAVAAFGMPLNPSSVRDGSNGALTARAADEGVWSGAISDDVLFGLLLITGFESRTVTSRNGLYTTESVDGEDRWEELGDYFKRKITLEDGRATASTQAVGIWSFGQNAHYRLGNCLHTVLWTENVEAHATSGFEPGVGMQPATVDIRVESSGAYAIRYGAQEQVHVTWSYHWMEWDDCTAPRKSERFFDDRSSFDWAHDWTAELTGTTCDPNRVVGSQTQDFVRYTQISDQHLLDFLHGSKERAAVIDPRAGEPAYVPFVRFTRSWDLTREDESDEVLCRRYSIEGTYSESWEGLADTVITITGEALEYNEDTGLLEGTGSYSGSTYGGDFCPNEGDDPERTRNVSGEALIAVEFSPDGVFATGTPLDAPIWSVGGFVPPEGGTDGTSRDVPAGTFAGCGSPGTVTSSITVTLLDQP